MPEVTLAGFRVSAVFASFIVLALGTYGSWAQTAEQKFQLDLDTVDGHFSSWKLDDVGAAKSLRATVKVTRLGSHERWLPFLRLEAFSKSAPGDYWGLLVHADKHVAPLSVSLVHRTSKGVAQEVSFAKAINMNETIAIELSWATPGKLLVRAGGETRELAMPASVTGVQIISGTGDFHLDNITLRRD